MQNVNSELVKAILHHSLFYYCPLILSPLRQEGISSPISAQILSFCDEDLFTETLRNSDVSSCYDDASLSSDFPPFSSIDASTISALLDSQPQAEQESDMILAPSYPPISQPNVFPNHSFDPTPITDITAPIGSYSSFPSDSLLPLSSVALPLVPQSLPSVFEDESILSMPGYMGLEPSPASTSSSFADPVMGGPFYSGSMSSTMSGERLAFYPVPAALETLQNPVTEYQGDYQGFYGPHGTLHQRIFCNSGDSQVVNLVLLYFLRRFLTVGFLLEAFRGWGSAG